MFSYLLEDALKSIENAKYLSKKGVNRRTDRRILKIFLPGFRIQSDILTDSRSCNCSGLQIHLFFGRGFWTLRVIDIFLPGFRTLGENGRADLVNKS